MNNFFPASISNNSFAPQGLKQIPKGADTNQEDDEVNIHNFYYGGTQGTVLKNRSRKLNFINNDVQFNRTDLAFFNNNAKASILGQQKSKHRSGMMVGTYY